MAAIFGVLLVLNLVAPWLVLWWLRRRWELESSFLALAAVGAGAAIAGYLGAMGLWVGWQAVGPVPASLPRAEVALRWDVLFFTTICLGFVLEFIKYYGALMFHTRMVRGNLPLFGVSVGAGAGMLQAFWVLGALVWAWLAGAGVLDAKASVLGASHLGLTVLEVGASVLVLYRAAEGRRVEGVVLGGALHGAALLLGALVVNGAFGVAAPWASGLIYAAAGVAAGGVVWSWVRRRGWPL